MPIYEYRCATCGFEKEYLQKVRDPLLTDCPSCGKPTLNKLVSAAGFQLKGSGWYVTDFRDNGKAPAKKSRDSEKSDSASQDKKDSSGTDASSKDSSAKDSSAKDSGSAAASGTGASPATS